MAYNAFYDGQPQHYYYYPSPPVTFRDPNAAYDNYHRDYRRQDDSRDQISRHGLMPMEQVVWRERDHTEARPWWLSSDHPHSGPYDGYYHHLRSQSNDHRQQYQASGRSDDHRSTVEMFVPLCCDECERKVVKHLKGLEGVESVSANQWEKKVVVEGYNLHSCFLLRRIQRDKPSSVLWCDRPQ